MKRFWKLWTALAVLALAAVLVAGASTAYTTYRHLEILPESWTGLNSLVVKNTAGTAKVTVTAAGATTFAGAVTTSSTLTPSGGLAGDVAVTGDLTVTGNDITFGNTETISNATNNLVKITSADTECSGDLKVTGNDISFGNLESITNAVDNVLTLTSASTTTSGDFTITGNTLAFGNTETIDNETNNLILITSANTKVSAALEVDGSIQADGGMALTCTGCITQVNLADTARTRPLPVLEWRTVADPPLVLTGATTPDLDYQAPYYVAVWSTGETTQKITFQMHVPDSYVSGMSLNFNLILAGAAAGAAETASITWSSSKTGEALGGAVNDECGAGCALAALTNATVTTYTVALDAATIETGDTIVVNFGFAAVDQDVWFSDAWLSYTGI